MKEKILVITSIHPDFDARVWRHVSSVAMIGFDAHIICPWAVDEGQTMSGVCFHPFEKVNGRISRLWTIPFRVMKLIKRHGKDASIIHFHDIDLLPWMALLALFGKNVVYDVHENYAEEMLTRTWIPDFTRNFLYYLVKYGQQIFASIIKNIVLVTEFQLRDFSNKNYLKVFMKNYASQSLMLDVVNDYMNRKDAVIFIGSQNLENGSFLYLEIAEAVQKVRPDVLFLASDRFGSQKFREEYTARVKRAGLYNLKLIPNVCPTDIVRTLNKATIAINPVLRVTKQIGAINTKLFEFMAAGLPIVTSDLPFPKQIIEDSSAGLLAQPEDVESFAREIVKLVDDRQISYDIGSRGKEAFIRSYTWESQLKILHDFYNTILEVEN